MRLAALLAVLGLMFSCPKTWGQVPKGLEEAGKPTPIPGISERVGEAPSDLLGDVFENQTAGISFRPPAGCTQIRKADQDHVAEYLHEERQWLLKVTRARLSQPMPLQNAQDGAKERVGLLDFTVKDILKQHPAAEVLRQDIVNVGENGVGIAILRFNIGNMKYLRQQAIFQSSETLYYVFNFTTPAGEGKAGEDPKEALSVKTFNQMLDTIQLLDRTWIKKDQVNRLYRTRALFTDWSDKGGKKLREAIVPEQWLRLVKDGKDIGYSYVVEEFMEGRNVKQNPARAFDGILISIRSRTMDGLNQVDLGTQMFTALDRKREDWAHIVNIVANKEKKDEEKHQNMEFGYSEITVKRVLDKNAQVKRDPLEKDPEKKNPPMREVETYALKIDRHTRGRNANNIPESHTPSPWYIPQAVGSMLPRLVPLHRPVTYLFQSYVSETHEVVHRYLDVGFEKEVEIEGKKVKAIGVSDRIRLEGTPTVHYMSPAGKYLGSHNEEAKIWILPTTRAELEARWKDANLTKPEAIERPAANGRGTDGR